MDHDVSGYDEPSFRSDEPPSIEDDVTVIVERRGRLAASLRPVPHKFTPEGAPLRDSGSCVVAMLPRARWVDSPAPLEVARRPRAVPHAPEPPVSVAVERVRRPTPRQVTEARWSPRSLAMVGAGMGGATALLVGVGVLIGLALVVPGDRGAIVPAGPVTAASTEGTGWIEVVTAVATTLVTGERSVDTPAPVVVAGTAPASAPVVGAEPAHLEAPAEAIEDASRRMVAVSVAEGAGSRRAPSSSRVAATPRASKPTQKVHSAPVASPESAPVPVVVAPEPFAMAPASGTASSETEALVDPWSAPTLDMNAEIDPWESPALVAVAEVDVPAQAPAWSTGPEVDLLAGDDGLGEGADYAPVRASLIDVAGRGDGPDLAAVADLESIETRVVRISVEGGAGGQIEIDGREVGQAPAVVDVEPGTHSVTLWSGDKSTTFQLEAAGDLAGWCFEARGRSFGRVSCK